MNKSEKVFEKLAGMPNFGEIGRVMRSGQTPAEQLGKNSILAGVGQDLKNTENLANKITGAPGRFFSSIGDKTKQVINNISNRISGIKADNLKYQDPLKIRKDKIVSVKNEAAVDIPISQPKVTVDDKLRIKNSVEEAKAMPTESGSEIVAGSQRRYIPPPSMDQMKAFEAGKRTTPATDLDIKLTNRLDAKQTAPAPSLESVIANKTMTPQQALDSKLTNRLNANDIAVQRVMSENKALATKTEVGTPAPGAPKQEAPKQEAPKQEAPGQEAPKQEAPKQEAPKQEAPKQEAPKQEAPGQEAPKQEAPGQEGPKSTGNPEKDLKATVDSYYLKSEGMFDKLKEQVKAHPFVTTGLAGGAGIGAGTIIGKKKKNE